MFWDLSIACVVPLRLVTVAFDLHSLLNLCCGHAERGALAILSRGAGTLRLMLLMKGALHACFATKSW
jgi:hypothetical protein